MPDSYRRSARLFPRLYPGEAMRRSGRVLLFAAILAATLGGSRDRERGGARGGHAVEAVTS